MKTYGLIGLPLEHSFSKNYFSAKFEKDNIRDCAYKNFPLNAIDEFASLIKSETNLCGLNVTIPYKESVIKFLDSVTGEAKDIDAVNCIKIGNDKLIGYNTDCFGFENSIKPLLENHHTDALVLGSGGSSKAVRYVLKKSGINCVTVSSSRAANSISYEEVTDKIINRHLLIINTTPLGMFPKSGEAPPIPYSGIADKHLLFDLIYNPEETLFLRRGKEHGAKTKNGLEMLQLQAEESWRIWNEV